LITIEGKDISVLVGNFRLVRENLYRLFIAFRPDSWNPIFAGGLRIVGDVEYAWRGHEGCLVHRALKPVELKLATSAQYH